MNVTLSVLAALTLVNAGFQEITGAKPDGWTMSGRWRADRSGGHNGGAGVVWESPEPSKGTDLVTQEVGGWKVGDAFRLSALMKTQGFRSEQATVPARICLEYHDANGKWLCGDYAISASLGDHDWTEVVHQSRPVPEGTAKVTVTAFVGAGCSGRIAFDNVAIEFLKKPRIEFVTTDAYRNTAVDGTVRIFAAVNPHEGEKVDCPFEVDVLKLPYGESKITCRVGPEEKELVFVRVRKLPDRRVSIDPSGWCLVNGRKFFPLGMYSGEVKETWMREYAKAPFNCVVPYWPVTQEALDICWKYGIMMIVDARCHKEREKNRAFVKYKDHPALLAWYTNDEKPAAEIPALLEDYEFFKTRDPDHPVFAVMDRWHDLRGFTPTCDVLGVDPYPVNEKPVEMIADFVKRCQAAVGSVRPFWNVPQAFPWSNYRKLEGDKGRFPTEEEIRSSCRQHLDGGAKGLVFYAYHQIGDRGTNAHFAERWQIVKKVACEIAAEIPETKRIK